MTSTRLKMTACALAALGLSACSTADLEMFNAGLEMYNGVQYYDNTEPDEHFECRSGNGYVTAHSGVRSNQKYIYFTSHAGQEASVALLVSEEEVQRWSLSPGEETDIYWTYPSYSLQISWSC